MYRIRDSKRGAGACNTGVCSAAAVLIIITAMFVSFAFGASADMTGRGESLYRQALAMEAKMEFTKAYELYTQALPLLREEGRDDLADDCAMRAQRAMVFPITYPYTLDELKGLIREAYPLAGAEEIALWTSPPEVEHAFLDGEEHYFESAVSNIAFRHLDLMRADEAKLKTYDGLAQMVIRLAVNKAENSFTPYHTPAVYRGTHTLSIPRDELPKQGTYRLWLPIPINTGAQTDVRVERITPEKWVKLPPSFDQDIGLIYMEIPMEELNEDLNIEAVFTFRRYEQNFQIDPANIGEYDRDSALYRLYTRSYGNTEITPDIQAMAEKIAGGEVNPYLAARKLYDYIVSNVTYALMPHFVMRPRTDLSESVYVHRYQRGDCGAQSMYFSAMCRALGIPARTTGGWQLFSGEFSSHFWAEFFLPNYGWVPVDTSFGQLALIPRDLSDEQRQIFIDFCFASQDSMRCVVQKDTDLPLIPSSRGYVLLPMAIQLPSVENTVPRGDLSLPFIEHWVLKSEKISGE